MSSPLQDGTFAEWIWGGRDSPKDMWSPWPCNWTGRLTGQAVPSVLAILENEKKCKVTVALLPIALEKTVNFPFELSRNTSGIT